MIPTRIVEIYKDVYIYGELTKYMISDAGHVKNRLTGHVLTPTRDKKGYLRVCLTLKHSKKYTAKIHILVAKAFIPNPENKPTVNHINRFNLSNLDNKSDNDVENLEWATHQEQSHHARKNGLIPDNSFVGENNPFSKYSDEKIREVCEFLEHGQLSQREISRITGVNHNTINKIRKGYSHTNISSEYNIESGNKLNHYSDEIKDQIKQLLSIGTPSNEIINKLSLSDTQASRSLIFNIKYKKR